ncbi:hypothetical protein [Hymenobacter cellulosivorans]|uniref:Uncharacterized protein n=1 Tax=Hymenobacter cellulosivorans TaxID=2932249 RepID=A0ABY4FF47_9BACT|nr:hypothetical protein [Hymenobacter cellulosivorans]UOQ54633.1 hypothetical protein MUN80_07680 [Hymenobacter cellulosivorans]
MKIDFRFDEPHSPQLQLHRSVWTGRTRLYVNDQEVIKEPKRGALDAAQLFIVPMPDGTERHLTLKNRFYDLIPEAQVNGRGLALAPALKSWEYAVACIPMIFLFWGGLIGGGVGVVATMANLSTMRSKRPVALRVGLCLCLTVAAFGLMVLLAGLVHLALAD